MSWSDGVVVIVSMVTWGLLGVTILYRRRRIRLLQAEADNWRKAYESARETANRLRAR